MQGQPTVGAEVGTGTGTGIGVETGTGVEIETGVEMTMSGGDEVTGAEAEALVGAGTRTTTIAIVIGSDDRADEYVRRISRPSLIMSSTHPRSDAPLF